MIRRPPRSTQSRSSAASDVYKRQYLVSTSTSSSGKTLALPMYLLRSGVAIRSSSPLPRCPVAVSYTHLRAHETRHDLVCRLLLEKKKKKAKNNKEQ